MWRKLQSTHLLALDVVHDQAHESAICRQPCRQHGPLDLLGIVCTPRGGV